MPDRALPNVEWYVSLCPFVFASIICAYREAIQHESMRVVELEGENLLLRQQLSRVRKIALAFQQHEKSAAVGVQGITPHGTTPFTAAHLPRSNLGSSDDDSDYLSVAGDGMSDLDLGQIGSEGEEIAAGGVKSGENAEEPSADEDSFEGSTDDEVMKALQVVHQVEYASKSHDYTNSLDVGVPPPPTDEDFDDKEDASSSDVTEPYRNSISDDDGMQGRLAASQAGTAATLRAQQQQQQRRGVAAAVQQKALQTVVQGSSAAGVIAEVG